MEKDIGLVIEKPLSIRDQVYTRIKDLILRGTLVPGERIIENQLAKQIGVSRTPVREALHVLEKEGLLEALPRVGYQVKETQWEEVEEICEIRKVIETLAARWAMQRLTPEQLLSLEHNLDEVEAEAKRGHPETFVELDADFHDTIARASGSRRLVEICQILRRHMNLYRIESVYEPENAMRANAAHRRILECLKNKDGECIEAAIHDHLDRVKQDVHYYAFKNKPGL